MQFRKIKAKPPHMLSTCALGTPWEAQQLCTTSTLTR